MGVYINLVEEFNGKKSIVTTGKYSINGMELIFNAQNHVGNGVFRVSGQEAIEHVNYLISFIYENENDFSATKTVNYYLDFLSHLSLNKDAVYIADFSEYFCCEDENKEYDPASIVEKVKQRLQDAVLGYCPNERIDEAFRCFGCLFKELPIVTNSFCSHADKSVVIVNVSLSFTEDDKKDFLRKYPSDSDTFVGDYNKRRLFYALKASGFDEFALVGKEPKCFSVVFTKEAVEMWLERNQKKTVDEVLAAATNKTTVQGTVVQGYEREMEY